MFVLFVRTSFVGLALCVLAAHAELVQLKRDWLPAATGTESLQFSIPFPTTHEFALALAGDIRVDWNGSLITTYATIDKQASYLTLLLEFTVPPELRRPGIVDFTLWDAANQRQLAYRGRVIVAIPTTAKIYEADPPSDRVVAYVPNGEAPDGGRVDVYSLTSGALVETIPLFAPQQVLAFTPDTTFAWIVENLDQGRVARLNLRTRQIDQTIQITAGAPPFRLIQAQVDRANPNLLMVFASSPGEESLRAYEGTRVLPWTLGEASPLPLIQDDRGRYLLGAVACSLDRILGFTGCSAVPWTARAIWKDKYLEFTVIRDLLTNERLVDDYGLVGAVYMAASDRLIGRSIVVDGATLEVWGQLGVSPDGFRLQSVSRAWAPNWLLAQVALTTQVEPEGILVGLLPELATAPVFTADAVVHGAAFAPGAIAPGEIISIFGQNLSLKEESRLTWEGPLSLADEINGVRVLFGGAPGTMLYAGPNQINVVAPETIAGLAEVEIQVIRHGIPSARVKKAVVAARPGLFSYSTAGRRYAAALHVDGRLQGPTTPLERGKPVSLFGTGLGLPTRLTADRIADRASETPVRPTVTIGGRPATVLYSGVSPGLTAGLAQINVVVPLDAPVGSAVEVVIEANGRSERNTWLAVQ